MAGGSEAVGATGRRRERGRLVAELALDERPRERLLRNGGRSLSDAELVAILLRTGCSGISVLDLARDLLAATGGLAGLLLADGLALRGPGLGPAKRATVLAAVEYFQ